MVRRSAQPPNPPEIRELRTPMEIDAAIAKLQRRVADVEQFRAGGVTHNDPRVRNVQDAISDAILEIFGKDSEQFRRHGYFKIDNGPQYVSTDFGGGAVDLGRQIQFLQHIPDAITRLEGLIQGLQEKLADLTQPHVGPRVAFQGRSLHSAIVGPSERLYLDGHYTQAVFEAAKALVELVKDRSGKRDLDGVPLMEAVWHRGTVRRSDRSNHLPNLPPATRPYPNAARREMAIPCAVEERKYIKRTEESA
jgi:hypothetical protein